MPSQREHYNAALENYRYLCDHSQAHKDHPKWGVVVMFYEILHLVERVFSIWPRGIPRNTYTHKARYEVMKRLRPYISVDILIKFSIIYDLSIDARYKYDKIDYDDLKSVRENEYKELKKFFKDLYSEVKKNI